jgi:hypothetical protein
VTDTGGFAFFFAWALFLALCLGLAYLILRARIPTVAPGERGEGPGRLRNDRPPGHGG